MTRRQLLIVLETSLLAVGVGLGVWCVARVVEGRYIGNLPVPTAQHRSGELPGDAGTSGTSGTVAPSTPAASTPAPSTAAPSTNEPSTAAPSTAAPLHVYVHVPVETGGFVAKLDAPTVKMSATILEGSDDHTLSLGAGHIEDTPFPGEPGNFGIAGHRDTTFRAVRNLKVGDPLVITTADQVFHYKITKTFIVEPDDVYVLDPADHPTLTLVTCYPFEYIGHAPHRYIISADLEKQDPR
jgi:sortase A